MSSKVQYVRHIVVADPLHGVLYYCQKILTNKGALAMLEHPRAWPSQEE